MIARCAHDGANEGHLVQARGDQWQMFTNLDAGDFGADRLELPTYFRRSVHLEIEDVLVRRSAGEENHDHRLVGAADAGQRFGLEKLGQAEAAKT